MDIRTLFLANAIADSCMVLALALYLAKRKTYSGFRFWLAATAASMVGGLAIGLRQVMPDAASVLLGTLCYPLAAVWRLAAARAFLGLGSLGRSWYALPAATLAVGLYLYLVVDWPQWRSFIATLAVIFPGGYISYLFFRHAPRGEALLHRTMGGMLALLLAVLLLRAVIVVGDPDFQILQASLVQMLFLLILLPTHLVMNLFFLMLNSQRLEMELMEAQAQVKTLGGLLPICAHCKKIRDDQGYWQRIEAYLERHSEASFTHGICPQCVRELYPEYVNAVEELEGKDK